MGAERLERVSLIDSLVNEVEQRIQKGEWAAGEQLPGEAELAQRFGVSRPVLRESLSRLRERGYVATINGRGTFVKRPDGEHLSATILRQIRVGSAEGYTVNNLYEVRVHLETATARLAAERAQADDLAALRSALDAMTESASRPHEFARADIAFHLAVASAARNPFLSAVLEPIIGVIFEGTLGSALKAESVADGLRMHARLLECIEASDAVAAETAMREHLADSRRAFPTALLG